MEVQQMKGRRALTSLVTALALMGPAWVSAVASSADSATFGESGVGPRAVAHDDLPSSSAVSGLAITLADTKIATPEPLALSVPVLISPTETVTHPVALELATYFDVPYDEIMGWREQGLGFGGIAKAYFLVDALGGEVTVTVEDVLELKLLGSGWGKLFKEFDLSPSGKDRNLGRVMSGRGDEEEPEGTSSEVDEHPGRGRGSLGADKDEQKTPPGQDKGKPPPGEGNKGRGKGKGRGRGKH